MKKSDISHDSKKKNASSDRGIDRDAPRPEKFRCILTDKSVGSEGEDLIDFVAKEIADSFDNIEKLIDPLIRESPFLLGVIFSGRDDPSR